MNHMLTWGSLSVWDKLSLFKKWYLITFIGDLCIIFGTLVFLGSNYYPLELAEAVVGFGAFFIWISVVKYF